MHALRLQRPALTWSLNNIANLEMEGGDLSCPLDNNDYNLQLAWYKQGELSLFCPAESWTLQSREFFASIVGTEARRTLEDTRFTFGANVACNFIELVVAWGSLDAPRPQGKSP